MREPREISKSAKQNYDSIEKIRNLLKKKTSQGKTSVRSDRLTDWHPEWNNGYETDLKAETK